MTRSAMPGVDLGSIPREVLVLVAAVAIAIVALQALAGLVRRYGRRRRSSLRMDRALRGEARAALWLEKLGYAIVGAQVAVEHAVRVGDRVVTIALRADYLVEKAGARFVVEVKTGALAPRIETSATRRQLLEYRIAFDVEGVLLVDGETGLVHEVTFPSLERRATSPSSWPVVAFLVAAAAALVIALR